MAKFIGFRCDVCHTSAEGEQKPIDWFALKLPGHGADTNRDFCSDKCLLKFGKARVSAEREANGGRPSRDKIPGLSAYLTSQGVPNDTKGAISAAHVRLEHERVGSSETCLVCQFLAGNALNAVY